MKRLSLFFVMAVTVCTLFLVFSVNSFAAEGEIECENAEINIVLDKEGNAKVTEELEFDFSGDLVTGFTKRLGIPDNYYDIDVSKVLIDGRRITMLDKPTDARPENHACVYKRNDELVIDMHFNYFEEHHKIAFYYTVKNAVLIHNDTAEFYWNIISGQEDYDIKQLAGRIRLPDEIHEDDINALIFWGDYENKKIKAENSTDGKTKTVIFSNEDMIKYLRCGITAALPVSLFPEGERIYNDDALGIIKEAGFSDAAVYNSSKNMFPLLIFSICAIYSIIIISVSVIPGCKKGRLKQSRKILKKLKVPKAEKNAEIKRPDEIKPALLYKLASLIPYENQSEELKNGAFFVTFHDLLNRGYIEAETDENGAMVYKLKSSADTASLTAYEKEALEVLKKAGLDSEYKKSSEIKDFVKKNNTLDKFRTDVNFDFTLLDCTEEKQLKPVSKGAGILRFIIPAVIIIINAIVSILVYFRDADLTEALLKNITVSGGAVIIILLIAAVIILNKKYTFNVRVLNSRGEKIYSEWLTYCKNLTHIKEITPEDFRKDTVYEEAFGMQKKFIYAVKERCPEIFDDIKNMPPFSLH